MKRRVFSQMPCNRSRGIREKPAAEIAANRRFSPRLRSSSGSNRRGAYNPAPFAGTSHGTGTPLSLPAHFLIIPTSSNSLLASSADRCRRSHPFRSDFEVLRGRLSLSFANIRSTTGSACFPPRNSLLGNALVRSGGSGTRRGLGIGGRGGHDTNRLSMGDAARANPDIGIQRRPADAVVS